jgi:hypothetical protein
VAAMFKPVIHNLENTKEEQTQRIISQEILSNQTMLVNHLLSGYDEANEFSIDDIENLYYTPKEELLEYIENTLDNTEINDLLDGLGEDWLKDLTQEILEEIAQDTGLDSEPQEIYQWYLVTDWLGDNLKAIGEPVLENDYGTWWGRTCCGQAIELDGTIQKIVDNLN